MNASRRRILSFLLAAGALWGAVPAAYAQSNFSAEAPFRAKAAIAEAFRLPLDFPGATQVALPPIDPALIESARQANAMSFTKRLQIGVGRTVDAVAEASSRSLQWTPTAAGLAARWEIASPGARALRIHLATQRMPAGVEIRFAGRNAPATVYGPFTGADVLVDADGYWSPVLEGESAIVEVIIGWGGDSNALEFSIAGVSHLFVSPGDPAADRLAKASGACEVDLICRSASDAALATTGRSVAKMTFSDGQGGGTFLCTGTLLNPIGGSFTPYFFSARHCMSTQASANTLTTHWFYDRTGCGSGGTSANFVQLPGGATLLYANAAADALLLRLNGTPPNGAIFSGWDASTLPSGIALTAVHHPVGDLKKVSLGSMGGFGSATGGSGTNFIISNWNSTATGVTEGGSSGSGIFTSTGSEYRLRGGLFGGPSSCTASGSNLLDYYSRFDEVYPAIAQYLSPATVTCSYALTPTSITLGPNATSGSVGVAVSSGCAWTAASNASWLTVSGSGNGNGTVSYSAAANTGASTRLGTMTVGGLAFTVTQQAAASAGANLVANGTFETGTASWTQSATGGAPIIYQDASFARSGAWYAWLGGYDSGTDTLYQEVTIPSGGPATLQFWYRIATAETSTTFVYDTMTVSIASATTGARLATLATYTNLNRTSTWTQSQAFDVSAFSGQTVRLVFSATTDGSNITSFYIDDITATANSGSSANHTALWWNAAESGWGINFNHQGDNVFGTLFTYSASGAPMWLVMSNGARQSGETFSGLLYSTTGPAFNANPFTPIGAGNITTVGTMTVTFSGNSAMLNYTVNGAPVTKNIVKQVFNGQAASCQSTTASRSSLTNYQDLWWNAAESGWGVNVTHQGDILFATLFTYAANGQGLWLVMSGGVRQPDGSYLGDLHQTTGPAFNAQPFTPIGAGNVRRVGTMQFRFSSGTQGTLNYTVDGVQVAKTITRQVFGSPVPACAG